MGRASSLIRLETLQDTSMPDPTREMRYILDMMLPYGNLSGVVAHELGHALSYRKLPGFRDVETVLHMAHARYNRENKEKLSCGEFMGKISRYAKKDAHEAFAEAFSDWAVNGVNAQKASLDVIRSWKEN